MPVFPPPTVPTEEFPGIHFSTLVAPRFGSADVAVCRVDIDPGTPAMPHSLTREEVGGDASVLELLVVLRVGGELNVPGGGTFQPWAV